MNSHEQWTHIILMNSHNVDTNNIINDFNNIFAKYCSNNTINNLNHAKMRCIHNGISLHDIFYYRFTYSYIHATRKKMYLILKFLILPLNAMLSTLKKKIYLIFLN